MEIKVYTADTAQLEDEELFTHLYKRVSAQRREKIERMRLIKDKRLSLGAGVLLETALAAEGVTDFTMTEEHNSKPCLACDCGIHFNISHSGTKVMCAVSDFDIGCDTEQITDINIETARRFFHAREYETLMKQPDMNGRKNLFFRYWTLKESFIKALGSGFKLPLNKFCLQIDGSEICINQNIDERKYFFKEFELNDGYKYAVCSADKPVNAEITFCKFQIDSAGFFMRTGGACLLLVSLQTLQFVQGVML